MLRQIGSRVAAGALAAVVLGVLAGGVARVLMRLLVVLSGDAPRFSTTGTLGVLLIFAMVMLPGAIVTALGRRRAGTVLLVLGAALLVFQSVNIPLQEDRTGFMSAGPGALALTLVVLLAFPAVIVAQTVATSQLAVALTRRLAVVVPTAERAAV
ncbi:hypothetical protein ATJ97_2130 [Georgenia soli]|uniref:Uncharacterized protein n=1 Tax=Georgenia soli TaxID=638953 RepID=A0A2A9EN27_9MICO|nr:hypothetical protein [Georgenia soli]PFG39619.1 hypothetical protein ATJ97_2130 [Georgenia soli]